MSPSKNENQKLLKAEIIIAYLLRVGVIVCAAFIALGMIMSWVLPNPGASFSSEDVSQLLAGKVLATFDPPHHLNAFISGHMTPGILVALGLILLIALPILRVALTVVIFLLEADYLYLILASVVLAVLIGGMFLGKAL